MSIRIFYDDVIFRLKGFRKIKKVVEKVIAKEKRISGDLNFILTSDNKILEINNKFLQRNYYTDVIAFDYSEGEVISGDIFISTETVKVNAKNYKVSYNEEIFRVIVHGVLHLCGYDDRTIKQKRMMRTKEDFWIDQWKG